MEINELAEQSCRIAKERGFWEAGDNVGEKLMLVVSELGEAIEAHRKNRFADLKEFERNVSHGAGEVDHPRMNEPEWFKMNFENLMKDSFEDNLADAVIRLAGLCRHLNIDLDRYVRYKMQYNETREKLHGKEY